MSSASTDEHELRRHALSHRLPALRAASILVSSLPNIRYLTGFTGSNALLVLAPDESFLLTDARYKIQAARETTCAVLVRRGSLWKAAASVIARTCRALAIETAHVPYSALLELRESLPNRFQLVPAKDAVEPLRMVKSGAEIELVRHSARVCCTAFSQSMRHFRPSMTERDLAAEIDYRMKLAGADQPAFETIVASGPNAALPHARPSARSIRANELLLIDMGAHCQGYASDLTRMAVPGRPAQSMKQRYRAVLEAQMAAIDAIRPGVRAADVDSRARRVLKSHRLESLFTHSTGHGLGIEIHEAPRIGRRETTRLEPGMVITVEPGVYLEKWGGIRIEDTVLVTPGGSEILTSTAKDLLVL